MKKVLPLLIFCLLMITCIEPVCAQDRNSLEWYRKAYGSLEASDHPLAAQAHEVFARLTEAADKPGDRYPKLLIVPSKSDPWALSLKDGGIILSQTALEFCYQDVQQPIGAARLAFILGHEIAHLAKGDFWHAEITEFMARYGSQAVGLEKFHKLVKNPGAIKNRELQADYHGMLYAFMAGYDPRVIVKQKDVNFFGAWTNQVAGKIAYDAQAYPSPRLRANHLLVLLENVNFQIDLFELGLRLYQKGDYDTALACLTHVQRQFPSREVLNNIGLIHFQKAMDHLSCFDKELAQRFKLATVLDTETRADIRDKCDTEASQKAFKMEIQRAVANFQEACHRDVHYVPARVNLASACILKRDYTSALSALEQAIQMKKDDLDVLNNNAVALYLFDQSRKIDTSSQIIEKLNHILHTDPDNPQALYNLASMLFDQNRPSEAKKKWLHFLKKEPHGRYATQARQIVGKAANKTRKKKPASYHIASPIEPGLIDANIKKKLKSFSATTLDPVYPDGIYYSNGDVRVLVARGFVKYVEFADEKRTKLSEILSRYGRPRRTIATAAGLQTYVYEKFAVDIRDNKVIKVLYFQ